MCNCLEVPYSTVDDMTLALDSSMKTGREKAFLLNIIFFVLNPENEKLT